MKAGENRSVYLKDYQPPSYLIESVWLNVELFEESARITNRMHLKKNPKAPSHSRLELNGEELELESVALDQRKLEASEYSATPEQLCVFNAPDEFELEVVTRLNPKQNTELQGLYLSKGIYCTQNEPEGFRRITYFLDRPDVMAVYTVRIEADLKKYPVLLANGNRIEGGPAQDGRHFVVWHDPFKKPCYLFALVGGDLGCLKDEFITASGRRVQLEIYVAKGLEPRCHHAMDSLKRSMRWDEQKYGLEYDLDIFMILAVEDFNSGAMENKGLNIFNSRYILADPKVATDTDYELIESVIAHEYFHNWTGNRVTCRDWFQLSLKEGLTVFRDQQFSSDMGAASVRRIADVSRLRTLQFAEDAGPMAHPIRPSSYMEINNFYTMTVYEKGAEVIRMIHTLLGPQKFREGMETYFALFDGQAVTTEDFVHAMEKASGRDLSQFKLWYSQAGTPEIAVTRHFDESRKRFTLHFKQSCRPTPESSHKKPFHLPIRVGLLNQDGQDLVQSPVLELTRAEQSFHFEQIDKQPIPSVLRGFSAPVQLKLDLSDEELIFLMAQDSDQFNRWDASQQIIHREIRKLSELFLQQKPLEPNEPLIQAFRRILADEQLEPAFRARSMMLPSESVYVHLTEPVHPEAIHAAYQHLLRQLALGLESEALRVRQNKVEESQRYSVETAGLRSLRNQCLSLLTMTKKPEHFAQAMEQLASAQNMTDEMAALSCLAQSESGQREEALTRFYEKWKGESLVINKWLQAQALAPLTGTLTQVRQLTSHPAFEISNPNKVLSLLVVFGRDNFYGFHARPEESYRFLADQVLALDAINPQVSSRLVAAFNPWQRFEQRRQNLMKTQLERLAAHPKLSKNVYEIVVKALEN